MPTKVPPRSKIDKKYTWHAESVFASDEAWENEIKQIVEELPAIKKLQSRLAEGPSILLEGFQTAFELIACMQKVSLYAGFAYAVDTTDQHAAGMRSKAQGVYGQVLSAVSFLQPEILSIGWERLSE